MQEQSSKTSITTAVEARNVSKIFGAADDKVVALDKVSVSIHENEFFTLLGPSGCGKTTLLRMIAGFEHPTEGEIFLYGEEISSQPPYQRPVNTVFQSYALFPHLTVAQNVAFGLEMLNKPKDEIADAVDRMLKLVRLEAMRNRQTEQISGGQQQRVALARALAPRPKVLLLDEPLSALDLKLRKEMQGELKRLQHETGITFIFVTHDQEEALTMSDRIAVMREGNILQIGSPREIYDRPESRFVSSFIGETNFIDSKVVSRHDSTVEIRFGGNETASAECPAGFIPDGAVTLAIRPEYIRIEPADTEGTIGARVTEKVYFGTDTHYHLSLQDGTALVSRLQNTRGRDDTYPVGSEVGLRWSSDSMQILKD
ncbi:MAG: spermidine/putrescine import ATP-binding protein PotA [marine bacterium B5-7]|nr:MAG: spermidine/putrescine import ATP-binding protein PotA [marine bacterium B5-7]